MTGSVRSSIDFPKETARRLRFEPTGAITATDVQNAIVQAGNLGSLNFTRNAQTANYSVANTDKGNLIDLSGTPVGLPFTLTLNAASGYDANFAVIVHNSGGARGWNIAASGRTAFILWPHQTALIFNDNNAWKFSPDVQPWIIPGGTTFNVDNVNGSDSTANDGLGAQGTSGAFLTIQNAIKIIRQFTISYSPNGGTAQIQLPPITSTPITEQITVVGAMPPGVSTIGILGNPTTPTNCQWQANSGPIANVTDYSSLGFNGIGFSGSHAIVNASQYAIIDFSNCDFGTNAASMIGCSANARANLLSGCSISGNIGGLVSASENGSIGLGSSIKLSGTPNLGTFAQAASGGVVNLNGLAFTGTAAGGGGHFTANDGGIIIGDSGVSWPSGMAGGQAINGGLSDAVSTTLSSLLATSPTLGLGYATGAGGTVTQATNKSTAVTLNTAAGAITMNNAALAGGVIVSFVLTDSAIAATDVLILNHISGGTPGSYGLNAQCAAGSATINVSNRTAGSLSEAIVIQFVVIKGATS